MANPTTNGFTELKSGGCGGDANRFKDADSVVFADVVNTKLTAVLDYHRAGSDSGARWGEHRSIYDCPLSDQWELWIANDGKAMTQDQFGEFIDANMTDLASPEATEKDVAKPADVLLMARNLTVRTKGEFSRIINPTTGEGSLISKLENDTASTTIPRAFLLKLPVFENGTMYRVEARVRFQMQNGPADLLVPPLPAERDRARRVRGRSHQGDHGYGPPDVRRLAGVSG